MRNRPSLLVGDDEAFRVYPRLGVAHPGDLHAIRLQRRAFRTGNVDVAGHLGPHQAGSGRQMVWGGHGGPTATGTVEVATDRGGSTPATPDRDGVERGPSRPGGSSAYTASTTAVRNSAS